MPHFPFGLTMGIMLSVPMVLAGLALIAHACRPSSLAPLSAPSDPIETSSLDSSLAPESPSDLMQGLAVGASESEALEDVPPPNAHGPGTPA
jgi:hypothetical protein